MSSSFGWVIITRARASICCSPPDRVPAGWSSRSASSGKRSTASSRAVLAFEPVPAHGVAADAEVLAHGEAAEGHLAPHQQGDALVDDLLGLEIGAVGAVDADDPPVGVLQPGHGPEQCRLAGTVGAEQGQDLPLFDLEVDVEQHLVGAVVEVEVVDLQGRHLPAGLAPLALRRTARGRPR